MKTGSRLALFVPFLVAMVNCQSKAVSQKKVEQANSPAEKTTPSSSTLLNFQEKFIEVAKKTNPSVVAITSVKTVEVPTSPFGGPGSPFDFFFGNPRNRQQPEPQERQQSGLGSGVVVSEDGYILTNNHVVEGADEIKIKFADGEEFDAKVVGTDPPTDLAVLKIEEEDVNLTVIPLGDSDNLEVGEWVVAVGSPFGLYQTVTTGIISAKGRKSTGITTYGNFLQTDAAINPGNSGGALVNLDSEVIGINTAIFSKTGGYQGIGFAIPINLAKRVMNELIEFGRVTRGWMGVSIQNIDKTLAEAMGLESAKGALINEVIEDSPADKANLQQGDVVVSLEGKEIEDANDLMNQVALLRPGAKVELGLIRNGKKKEIEFEVGKREEEELAAAAPTKAEKAETEKLGMTITNLNNQIRQQLGLSDEIKSGVVITNVLPGSKAQSAGLRPGDIILQIKGEKVKTVSEFQKFLKKIKPGKNFALLVSRGGKASFFVAMEMPE